MLTGNRTRAVARGVVWKDLGELTEARGSRPDGNDIVAQRDPSDGSTLVMEVSSATLLAKDLLDLVHAQQIADFFKRELDWGSRCSRPVRAEANPVG